MYENGDGYLKDKDRQTIYICISFLCVEIILTKITGLLWLICWGLRLCWIGDICGCAWIKTPIIAR